MPSRVLTLKAENDYFEALDHASKQLDMSRSLLIRNLIVFSLILLDRAKVVSLEGEIKRNLYKYLSKDFKSLLDDFLEALGL